MTDDSLRPSPVRILCADGIFTSDASPAVVSEYSAPREFTPTPKFQYVALGNSRTSERAARERVARRASTTRRRRQKNVPIERIRELQALGLSVRQMGRELGCYDETVVKRLREGK